MLGFNIIGDNGAIEGRIYLNPENCTFITVGEEVKVILPCGLVYMLDHDYDYVIKIINQTRGK